mmetsp:Transcript_7529/g.19405  ORF Transcript_7529/g.19405 Transcript_7529/m.19405 type:complete len:323 (+) Transcript_7529:82-1050(+)
MRHEAERPIWQRWPGQNFFLCDGRMMGGPTLGGFYFTFFMAAMTVALFNAWTAVYLWREVSPIIPLLCGYTAGMTLIALVRTTFSDPGIIPRTNREESGLLLPREPDDTMPEMRVVRVRGVTQQLKYCDTCCIYRPPRSSHCRVCDNCVEGFDHHCPWVSNCVGRRNYRFFILFVVHLQITLLLYFIFSIVQVVHMTRNDGGSIFDAFAKAPGTPLVLIICFFAFFTTIGLPCFHSNLLAEGITTNEYIKRTHPVGRSPYSKGSFTANLAALWFGPQLPSLLRLRRPLFDWHFLEVEPESEPSEASGEWARREPLVRNVVNV